MCQILFSEKANPPRSVLEFANRNNKDGFGYAYVSDEGKVVFKKGFTESQLTDSLIDAYFELPFPKAIHFRLATHGGVSRELTHPFPIKRGVPLSLDGEADAVLFHNGVWHSWDDRMRDGILGGTINPNFLKQQMSDSRAFAILAQRFGPEILEVLNIGQNKILILTNRTWIKYGDWTKREGWCASSFRIEEPSHFKTEGQYNSGSGTSWEPSGSKDDRRWKYKRHGKPPSGLAAPENKTMYLDASRAEIEESEREWRQRFDG